MIRLLDRGTGVASGGARACARLRVLKVVRLAKDRGLPQGFEVEFSLFVGEMVFFCCLVGDMLGWLGGGA